MMKFHLKFKRITTFSCYIIRNRLSVCVIKKPNFEICVPTQKRSFLSAYHLPSEYLFFWNCPPLPYVDKTCCRRSGQINAYRSSFLIWCLLRRIKYDRTRMWKSFRISIYLIGIDSYFYTDIWFQQLLS